MVREIPHVEGVRHVFLDLNGIRVHVAEAGPADAPPAILLHGWPQHWYMWRQVIGALQADFRLLTKGNGGDAFLDAEVNEFADSLRQPARADAVSRLYRYYLRVFRQAAVGHWRRSERLTVPALILFGEDDVLITRHLLPGFEAHSDQGRLEFVAGCGHFIVDEQPELVAERARSFLHGQA